MRTFFFVILMFVLGACRADDVPVKCDALLMQELPKISELSLKEFDQTPGKGWRLLNDAQCYAQAEQLMRQYLAKHGPQSSLIFHLGQVQLRQEKRAAAAESFRLSLRPGEPAIKGFKFNEFALALAAYAEQDRARFDTNMAVVKAGIENYGNRMNMNLLSAISAHFEAKYVEILDVFEKAQSKGNLDKP